VVQEPATGKHTSTGPSSAIRCACGTRTWRSTRSPSISACSSTAAW
jgi:hypothetical protein